MRGELRVRCRAVEGRTRVVESYARAPFHYLPPAASDPPLLTIVNSSGGVLGGDSLDMGVDLEADTKLTLRTQAATKVYRSTGVAARSSCRLTLGDRAVLDYFSEEIIPFAGSDYEQLTFVDLGVGAVALVAEIVTAGRLARGERFAFTRLGLDLRCTSADTLLLRDRAEIRPAVASVETPAILGRATVWGSFYWMTTQRLAPPLIERIDEALNVQGDGSSGASETPCGLVGRVLGTSVDSVRAILQTAHAAALESVLERHSA